MRRTERSVLRPWPEDVGAVALAGDGDVTHRLEPSTANLKNAAMRLRFAGCALSLSVCYVHSVRDLGCGCVPACRVLCVRKIANHPLLVRSLYTGPPARLHSPFLPSHRPGTMLPCAACMLTTDPTEHPDDIRTYPRTGHAQAAHALGSPPRRDCLVPRPASFRLVALVPHRRAIVCAVLQTRVCAFASPRPHTRVLSPPTHALIGARRHSAPHV